MEKIYYCCYDIKNKAATFLKRNLFVKLVPLFVFVFFVTICKPIQAQLSPADSALFNSIFVDMTYIDVYNFPGKWNTNCEIQSLNHLQLQVDSIFPFKNNDLAIAYDSSITDTIIREYIDINDEIDSFNVHYNTTLFPAKRAFRYLNFTINNKPSVASFILDSCKNPNANVKTAFVVLTGTGSNQLTAISNFIFNYHNTNCHIRPFLNNFGDVYLTGTAAEDNRAIHWNYKKLSRYGPTQPSYLNNYLNSIQQASGINKLIETIALVKYLKSKYKKVIVLGLSTGGTEALWASILSRPSGTLLSSGYSILTDTNANSLWVNSIYYDSCLYYFNKDSLMTHFNEKNSNYLITQALNDNPLIQMDIDSNYTPNFFAPADNVHFNYSYYNHSFPPCFIMDSFINKVIETPILHFNLLQHIGPDSILTIVNNEQNTIFHFDLYLNDTFYNAYNYILNNCIIMLKDTGTYTIRNIRSQNGYYSECTDSIVLVHGYIPDNVNYYKIIEKNFNIIQSQNTLYINPFDLNTPYDISLLNTQGQLLHKNNITYGKTNIEISDLSIGMYFLQINMQGHKYVKKIVKQL